MKHHRARWVPVLLFSMLLVAIDAGAAETPVASAPIPPIPAPLSPPPPIPPAPKHSAAAPLTAASGPTRTERKKRPVRVAHRKRADRKLAGGPAGNWSPRPPVREAPQFAERFYQPPRRALASRYYPGEFMPGAGGDVPPFAPPWYDSGPPPGYPYPGSRWRW